jgi:HSP20 family protein
MWRGGEDMDPFEGFRREMNRLFDDAFRGFGLPSRLAGDFRQMPMMSSPKIDVSESDKELRVCAELPGVKQDDIEVMLENDTLLIRGEMKEEHEDQDKDRNYHVRERMHGAFSRALPLHFKAEPGQVRASFRDGVLTITIPKPPEAQQKQQRIRVESEAGSAGARPQSSTAGPQTGRSTAGTASSPASRPGSETSEREKQPETAAE